jgi:putative hydrolase of the HAD superfamily
MLDMSAAIRAVCFDLDNTLWDAEVVISRAEDHLHGWLEQHYPLLPQAYSVSAMRAERLRMIHAEPEVAHDLSHVRRECLARHAAAVGYGSDLAEQALEVFLTARNQAELFADVGSALARLRQRYTLASLTNGNADLVRIGIQEWFAVSLTAADVGVAKPHARAFERVVQALGLDASEVIYVGDDPHLDIAGARAAGLRTAWMNRKHAEWPDELLPADFVVTDCYELSVALGAT